MGHVHGPGLQRRLRLGVAGIESWHAVRPSVSRDEALQVGRPGKLTRSVSSEGASEDTLRPGNPSS